MYRQTQTTVPYLLIAPYNTDRSRPVEAFAELKYKLKKNIDSNCFQRFHDKLNAISLLDVKEILVILEE